MIHTVLPGETLRGIAAMHGIGPDLLAAWNGTAEPLSGQELLVPMEEALAFLPRLEVDPSCAMRLKNGNAVWKKAVNGPECPAGRVFCGGEFYGIGALNSEELLIRTMLYSANDPS